MALSPDGKMLATAERREGTIKLWDVATGKAVATFRPAKSSPMGLAFSPDGTRLAVGTPDRWTGVWDVRTREQLLDLDPGLPVVALCYSPDGKHIAAGCPSCALVWDAKTGQQLARLPHPKTEVWAVAFTLDGRTLVTGAWDEHIRLWDLATHQERAALRKKHSGDVSRVDVSPDGKLIASGGYPPHDRPDEPIGFLWGVGAGKPLRVLEGLKVGVTAVRFSPDGKLLATANGVGTVRLWDVATGKVVGAVQEEDIVRSLAFTPDSKKLFIASQNFVKAFDVAAILKRGMDK
jgi:WD40 repeat protein